ncbi:MAG: glycosyltransferase family 4 protein [Acidimicrobiia bacterium]|nr:glycosyltransferase family 4 protein [Acidimicrobiia bacterium]
MSRPPAAADRPLRVGIEAIPLLVVRTGVGTMTRAVVDRLANDPGLEMSAILISLRGRTRLAAALPPGMGLRAVPFPARLAHRLWLRGDHPALGGFDVIHGPNFVVPPAAADPLRLRGGRRRAVELLTIHDFGPWHYPGLVNDTARNYPRLVARALERGAHVHTVSAFVGSEAADILGVDRDRIHVIPNGFAPGPAGDPTRGRGLAGGDPYVLAVGTIEPRKDLPTLVEAMARLWAEGHDTRLVLAGPDGWGTPELDRAVARTGAAHLVRRLGYVSDAERADLLAGAACLAYPSRYEGFGLPPLEAMAQGTPVVATTIGAVTEVCADAALLVPPGDPDALARALATVLSDDAEAARLVAAGRQRPPLFSWDRTAADLGALYRHLATTR